MSENLFTDFPYTTAAKWIAQIEKDLKGKSRSDMHWSPDGQFNIDPFVHAEDVTISASPINAFGKWQISESFMVKDARESNLEILEALDGGAESLRISCREDIDWENLFAYVELPFVHVGLEIDGDVHHALRAFYAFVGQKYQEDAMTISLQFSNRDMPIGSQASPMSSVAEFPFVRISLSPVLNTHIAEGLCATIYNTLVFGNWNPEQLGKCNLSVTVGMHYLVEIARLRALRILWSNVASVLKFTVPSSFTVEARTLSCSPDDDPYSHMIRSTVMGLGAVLGGADRIEIQPAIGANHSRAFYRHIARNIHHLLRMESKFSEITDPIAGAYYIDRLTRDMVEKTWGLLLLKMKT